MYHVDDDGLAVGLAMGLAMGLAYNLRLTTYFYNLE